MSLFLPLDYVAPELWELIGYHTISSEEAFLGPPATLCALLLSCRKLNHILSWKHNPALYAKIFARKFDIEAPKRRFSQEWLTTTRLTAELKKRFEALQRIKAKIFHPDDLWTAYLMFLEADGNNEAQLLSFANLRSYLVAFEIQQVTQYKLLTDTETDSLILWLMWFSNDRDYVRNLDSKTFINRRLLLHVLVAVGYRYPTLHAPDKHFSIPLESHEMLVPQPGSLCPPSVEIFHYNSQLRLASPILSSSAILNLCVQAEESHVEGTSRWRSHNDTPDGATLDDFQEFHFQNRIFTPLPYLSSKANDQDWNRLVSCHDVHAEINPPKRSVYRLGSLSGNWGGRIFNVDYGLYMNILAGKQSSSSACVMNNPLHWELKEHHCLFPDQPLALGLDEDGSFDTLHAFIPRDAQFNHTHDGLDVYNPKTGRTARYETYFPDDAVPYSKAALKKLQRRWISDATQGEIAEQTLESAPKWLRPNSWPLSTSDFDDDEYSDPASKVRDILITGKTSTRHARAWGDYSLYGRVRAWDGLVILFRFPTSPTQDGLGRHLFKGYIHDRNLVGRWRDTFTPKNMIGYEGGFVVAKTDSMHN
ncbi:hypothetical protein CPB83DRAFT_880763 [Crepidotus variabilis]|uniref:F-box domain-containing protein n=1 Tax=Crepidotus variabilis TaxID=179855 RepID=A0A9P6EMS0_9AGAR|nr:hypothetical protein CPB83DRAFT_880763 [Crepidotus variabilis]